MRSIAVAGALAGALALGACTDPNDRNQRALTGAAVGAAGGALIGSVTGSAGRGALIGGAVGGVAGALTPPPQPERIPPGYSGYSGYDPRYGGYYDQFGRWVPAQQAPQYYGGYQPNYR